MLDLQLDITDLEDLMSTKNSFMQQEFLNLARAHLGYGNRVVIKRTYMNSPSDFIRAFTTVQEFETFWKQLYGNV